MKGRATAPLLAFALAFGSSAVSFAAPKGSGDTGGEILGRPLFLIVLLASLSLLPFVFMSLTAFAKISTVLQIAKSAIGAQSVPSNAVVLALSTTLALTAMWPVGQRMSVRLAPVLASGGSRDSLEFVQEAVRAAQEPLRDFLAANASTEEKARFLRVTQRSRESAHPGTPPAKENEGEIRDTDFAVLAPAFMTTELTEAFAVGFFLYLPFLVLDLVIANVLLALGMQMLSPTQMSLPFKLLLFVGINGWGLLSEALVSSYR